MFWQLMWPSTGRYKQEHNYNSVRTTPPLKISIQSEEEDSDYIINFSGRMFLTHCNCNCVLVYTSLKMAT